MRKALCFCVPFLLSASFPGRYLQLPWALPCLSSTVSPRTDFDSVRVQISWFKRETTDDVASPQDVLQGKVPSEIYTTTRHSPLARTFLNSFLQRQRKLCPTTVPASNK